MADVGRDDDVAGGQQPDAAGPRRPADDGDHRLRRGPDRLEQLGELAHALLLRAAAGGLGRGPCPEQNTRPVWSSTTTRTASSASASASAVAQLGAHRPGERVAVGGGVEGQRRDAARHRRPAPLGRRSQPHPAGPRRARGTLGADEHRPAAAGDPGRGPFELPGERPRGPDRRRRSASTCTCRSARPAAATATSTPTPPTSSAPAPTAPSTPAPRSPSCAGPRDDPRPRPADRSPPSSSAAARPTLLPADDLAAVLAAVRDLFPVADDVEVTTEANPESVDPGLPGPAARGRLHPGQPRHAVRRRARARRPRPPAHARAARSRPRTRPAPPASSTSTST